MHTSTVIHNTYIHVVCSTYISTHVWYMCTINRTLTLVSCMYVCEASCMQY